MKALILSDIHSNIVALEKIWEREKDSDVIYCAGDLVDYGFYPREVIRWFREHRVQTVAGNHDRYVLGLGSGPLPAEGPHTFARLNASLLSPEDFAYLQALPEHLYFEMDGYRYLVKHYPTPEPSYETLESRVRFDDFWNGFSLPESDLPRRCIFGHTHRSCVHILGEDYVWMNPGSVSYRRADDPTKDANYITVTDGKIELKQADYPKEELRRRTEAANLTEHEYRTAKFFWG